MKTRGIRIIALIFMLLAALALLGSATFLKAAAASGTTTWVLTGTQYPPDQYAQSSHTGTISGSITTSSQCSPASSIQDCLTLSIDLVDSAYGVHMTIANESENGANLAVFIGFASGGSPYLATNLSWFPVTGPNLDETLYPANCGGCSEHISGNQYAEFFGNGNPGDIVPPPGSFFYSSELLGVGPLEIVHGIYTLKQAPNPPPTLAEYLQLSDAAYELDKGSFVVPPGYGLTILPESFLSAYILPEDGFEAYAVKDSNGNIIIANEGTVPPGSRSTTCSLGSFCLSSLSADYAIYKNQNAQALADARIFALKVEQDYPGPIYVTGHSLGGIEAEAEAQALGANFAGGATFGATGLPGNTTAGGPPSMVNYVDSSDPIGNYASDPECALHNHLPFNSPMFHYGKVVIIGTSNDLSTSVAAREFSLALPPQLGGGSDDGNFVVNLDNALDIKYHTRENYATDLNIPLTHPVGTISPDISFDEWSLTYGEQLGDVGLSDATATTVSNATTLVAPDLTLKFDPATNQLKLSETLNIQETWGTVQAGGVTTMAVDPQTGLITTETYKAPDSSVFNATFDSSETVTVVQSNPSTGGSYQIVYDTGNSQPWSSSINFYAGANEHGPLTETLYNWRAGGGSQVQLFTNLPPGVIEEIENFSGPDGTGTLLSTQFIYG